MADDGLRIVNTVDNSQVDNAFARMRKEIVSSAEAAQQQGRKIDDALDRVALSANATSDTLKRRIHESSQVVNELTAKIIEQRAVVKDVQVDVKRLGDAYKEAKAKGTYGASGILAEYNAAKKALEEEKSALFALNQEKQKASLKVKELRGQYELMKKATDDNVLSLGMLQKGFMALGGTMAVKAFTQQVIQTRGEFQQLEVAFTTMLGSAEKANTLMMQLTKTAAVTPFDLKGVTDGAKQLLAYGVAADEVNDTLVHLGDIAAGLSLPLGDLVYLYGTTLTQGRMFTQDLRQFMGRGIPIAEELAKQFGVTKDKVQELVSTGKVGAEEFKQAIMSMSSEGGKFGGLMEKQSKTITGQISNIEDAIDNAFNKIGKQSEGAINTALDGVSYLVENYEKVGKIILSVAGVYGIYKAAVLAVIAVEKIMAMARLAHIKQTTLCQLATDILTKKMALLNSTMMMNPWVLAATAIAGLIAVLINLETQADRVKKAEEDLNNEREKAIRLEQEHKSKIEELCSIAGNEELSTENRRLALVKLEQQYPTIFAKYDTEAEKLAHILELKNAINEADGKKSVTVASNEYAKNQKEIDALQKKGQATYTITTSKSGFTTYYQTGGRTEADEARLTALRKRQQELSKQIQKDKGNAYITNLTGVSNADLDAQIKNRQNLLAKMKLEGKKYGTTTKGGVQGTFTAEELQGQLQIFQSEKNRRTEARYTPAQRKAQLQSELANARKALADFDKSSTKYTVADAEKKRKELQDAVSDAEKRFKAMGGSTSSSSRGGRGGSTDTKAMQERIASEQKRLEDLEDEIALQRIRKEKDLANRLTDVRLEAEGNSAKMLAKKREQDNKEEILAIERERDDAMKAYVDGERKIFEQKEAIKKAKNPNYTKQNFDKSSVDTSDIKKQYDDIIAYTKKIQAQDIAKEQSDALNTYLAEYGTFEQRKLAITEQYEEKIKAAVAEGEKLTLEEQLRSALSAVDTDALKRNIDWAEIFGDMGGMLYDEMRDNLKKLEEYMQSSEFLKLGATDQKNIADVASQLRSKVGGGTADFSKLGAQVNALQKVMQELNEAEQREKDAVLLVKEKQEAYNKALADGKQDLTSYETELNEAKQSLNECSAEVKNLSSQAEQSARSLHDNLGKVVTGLNNLSSGLQGLKSGSLQGAFEGLKTTCSSLSTLINGKVGQALGAFAGKLGGVIGQIVESALGLLDILKDGISSIITSLLDTVFNAVNGILHDVLSGEIVTNVIGSITNGITNIFDTLSYGALSNWLGGNKEDNENEIAKLSQSNDMLRQSIDGLAETIKSSDTTNSQSVEAYKKAIAAQEEWEQNQRNAINLRASEYSNSGHGFLGLGGKHSFNHYLNDKGGGWYGWQDFNNALQQNGVNKTVGSAGDIWNLSPEEMKLLRDFAPTAWMELLRTDGESNPSDLISAYIEKAGVGEQLISQLNEKLTGYSWDGFKNSFVSALEDMDSTTEDFANNIQKVISNAILNSLVTSQYQDRIKALYKMIADAAQDDDISKEEAEAIRAENEAIANAMLADRERLKNMGILQDGSEYKQEASTKGFQAMSQDTGEELNGRFTAIQIAAYDLKDLATARNEMLTRMEQNQGSVKTSVEGITDALALTNIHLSDIAKYTKHLIAMKESLDDIKNNTKHL